ncbi:MAG: hypothetical protein ACLRFF_03450 [Alphaproteobacteria bacterium]
MNITTYKSSDMRRALCLGGLLSILCVPLWGADPDIANNVTTPSCDDSVLNTDTGPADIEINWAPNHITLNWYEDSSATTPMTVGTASQSCDYDGALTIPAPPAARTGYTFKGWRVKQCSLSGLDTSISTSWDATHTRWKPIDPTGTQTMALYFGTENNSDLNNGEWAVTFSYGTVKGMAKCSAKRGDHNTFTWSNASSNWSATESDLTSASGEAKYCWCHATNYTPNGGNRCNVASPSWVFYAPIQSASDCADECALACANLVMDNADFRRAVFGVSQ